MKYFFLVGLIFMACASESQINIKRDYCIVNDSYNEMGLRFRIADDSVFLYYINVIDNGNYLNDYEDSNDYAGVFIFSEIRNNYVALSVRNYRTEEKYPLKLFFKEQGNEILWVIDSAIVSYLPSKAEFHFCK
jgi:hypothetical protein